MGSIPTDRAISLRLGPPQPLSPAHCLDEFACGESVLDDWLKRRAMANHLTGASRTFVVADENHCVLGYYAIAAGAVARQLATGNVRRNRPDPIPVMVLARLAVDGRTQGIKLGAALLKDAVQRAAMISENAGVRALLVHALHDRSKRFYEYYGFRAFPIDPLTLMLRLNPKSMKLASSADW